MKYLFIFLGLACLAQPKASAQFIHVLNEGSGSKQGSVGAIDASGTYVHIDSIAPFGNDLKVHPTQNIYAVVDGAGNIREYAFGSTPLPGAPLQVLAADARQLDYHPATGRKAVTCLQKPFFRIYDANNQLLYSLDTNITRGIAEGVKIVGNKAYFTINNFGMDSLLQVVDMNTGALLKTLTTHPNPNNLIYDAARSKMYIQILYYSEQKFEIQELDLTTDNITNTHTYTGVSSYGGLTADAHFIYFTNMAQGSIARIDLQTWSLDTTYYAVSPYALFADTTNQYLYFSETDYVSSGTVSWLDIHTLPITLAGNTLTHISPRAIAKTRIATSIEQFKYSRPSVYIAHEHLQVSTEMKTQKFKLLDITGKTILELNPTENTFQLPLQNINSGMYFWQTTDFHKNTSSGKIWIP